MAAWRLPTQGVIYLLKVYPKEFHSLHWKRTVTFRVWSHSVDPESELCPLIGRLTLSRVPLTHLPCQSSSLPAVYAPSLQIQCATPSASPPSLIYSPTASSPFPPTLQNRSKPLLAPSLHFSLMGQSRWAIARHSGAIGAFKASWRMEPDTHRRHPIGPKHRLRHFSFLSLLYLR